MSGAVCVALCVCVCTAVTRGLGVQMVRDDEAVPTIFEDPSFALSSTWRMSTSNCTNPALQGFAFGPVVTDGIGVGYTVDPDHMSFCTSAWRDAVASGDAPCPKEYNERVVSAIEAIADVLHAEGN